MKNPALYLSLFFFLLAVYLLTYTPRINSSDGLAMFATAESIIRRGAVDIEQIRWMGLQQGTFGLDGLLYSRKGIGVPMAMLPLTWLGFIVPGFGTVGASLLFNALVTALTAILLMAYLRHLSFSRPVSLIVALVFGLATLAWPYAKSLFSDPFSGFLLLAAAFMLLKIRHSQTNHQLLIYSFMTGILLGWNVATRFAETIFIPIFGLLFLHYLYKIEIAQNHQQASSAPTYALRITHYAVHITKLQLSAITAFTVPILVVGLALIGFNIYRYGDPLNTGYLPQETFSGVLWEGVLGQLVSPGRGLLLYCPILILSFWGFFPFYRRFKAETLVALSVIVIHLALYGKWFMWHGGYAWGPRFMIPTLPFWAVFLAPVVERAFANTDDSGQPSAVSRRVLRVIFLTLATLSLIPQLMGVIIDFAPFQNSLLDTGLPLFARETFFNPQYSAFLGAWTFISPDSLDLVWVWQGQFNWGLLVVLLLNIVVSGYFLEFTVRHPVQLKFYLLPLLTTLITVSYLLTHTHSLPPNPLKNIVAELNQSTQPTDAIITNDAELAMPFAELYKGRTVVLGLNNAGASLSNPEEHRLKQIISAHKQIWWLPNWVSPEDSAIEQTLLADTIRVRQDIFDAQRLVLYTRPPDASANNTSINAMFDNSIVLIQAIHPPTGSINTAFPIELHWQAVAPLTDNYNVFIHLIDTQGNVITQADGQPAQWTRPTSSWQINEIIVDRHALWIPSNIFPGSYQLRVGLYQPENGQRLPLSDGNDAITLELTIK